MSCAGISIVCLIGFLTSSSATRISRMGSRLTPDNLTCCHTERQSGKTMTSVSADHIILTPTQPIGRGRPQGPNPGPPDQESRAIPTEQPLPVISTE